MQGPHVCLTFAHAGCPCCSTLAHTGSPCCLTLALAGSSCYLTLPQVGPHVLLTFDNAWHYILALTYSWPTQIGHSEANIVAKFLGLSPLSPPPPPPPPPPNPVLAVVDAPHHTSIKILSILWRRHAAPYCPIACSARWHAAPCSTR